MKTQNTKLDFRTESVVELNDHQLTAIAGGSISLNISISVVIKTGEKHLYISWAYDE